MEHYYRTIAEKNFSHEPNIKVREELAEQLLIRNFLGEQSGLFVEVGANKPFALSQTWHLANIGWSGILVEPIPHLCEELREKRPESIIVEAACGAPNTPATGLFTVAQDSGKSTLSKQFLDDRIEIDKKITVKIRTLDSILEDQEITSIDFVSIDVEGAQMEVLKGFTIQRWSPRLLLIEDHLLDLKSHKHICKQGYVLVKRTLFNNWYIPAENEPPKTGGKENRILKGKLQRVPIRHLRYRLRKLLGKGI